MSYFSKTLRIACITALIALWLPAFADSSDPQPGKSYPTTDEVKFSGLKTTANGTYFTVSLDSKTDITYCAYNMVIALPPGISFAHKANGDPRVTMNKSGGFYSSYYDEDEDETIYNHELYSKVVDDKLRLICISWTNADFANPGGALFNVYVDISPWAKAGANDVTITETKFVTVTEVGYIPRMGVVGSFQVSGDDRQVPVNISADNKVATCILPFEYTPTGFEAYSPDFADDSKLYLNKVETMEAYTPYILLSDDGCSQTLVGTALEQTYPGTAVVDKNGLCGIIQPTLVEEGYILQNQGDGPRFYRIGETPYSLKAGKCYLKPISSGRMLAPVFRDTSGIANNTKDTSFGNSDIYDLNGNRVSEPTPGNVYVQNGKKFIKL